mgnify:CR=1 FL=1
MQSSGYGHALKVMGVLNGQDPIVRHDVLLKNHKKPDLERYATLKTEAQRNLAIKTASEVAATIETSLQTGLFHRSPNPQSCPTCEFRQRCMSSL